MTPKILCYLRLIESLHRTMCMCIDGGVCRLGVSYQVFVLAVVCSEVWSRKQDTRPILGELLSYQLLPLEGAASILWHTTKSCLDFRRGFRTKVRFAVALALPKKKRPYRVVIQSSPLRCLAPRPIQAQPTDRRAEYGARLRPRELQY